MITCNKWPIKIPTGPAPDGVTNKIYEISKNIVEYRICPELCCDISKIGTQEFTVSVFVEQHHSLDTASFLFICYRGIGINFKILYVFYDVLCQSIFV